MFIWLNTPQDVLHDVELKIKLRHIALKSSSTITPIVEKNDKSNELKFMM